MKRLGDGELEIMLAVWGEEGPVSSTLVQEKLRGRRDWALPAEKRGRSNCYRPLIAERDYKAAEGRGLLDRLYGSSFKGLVASLYDSRAIGKNELEDLRKFLDELEGK